MKKLKMILLLLVVVLFGCVLSSCAKKSDNTESLANDASNGSTQVSDSAASASNTTQPSGFEIHFLDVGQGDSALVICDGQTMLIDGGSTSASSRVYSYLKSHNVFQLDYMIATHPDEDHIGGLAGALNFANVATAFCCTSFDSSSAFSNLIKYLDLQNVSLTVPHCGDTYSLGSALVEFIGPVCEYPDDNNSSLIVRIVYRNTAFLFMGDAESLAETDLLLNDCTLSADVLKVAHHGSASSTSDAFLNSVNPNYAIISVGRDNTYGHPSADVINRLSAANIAVLRTDLLGTVICHSDGDNLSFYVEHDPSDYSNSLSESTNESLCYIGNARSHVFHKPTCPNLPAEKNRIYFETREDAVEYGFSPCGNCMP